MKTIISFAIFTLLSVSTAGQNTYDTVYYDSKWKITSNKEYSYYRITKKQVDGKFLCLDYWKTGETQMKGVYSSLDPDVKDGEFIHYHKNGKIKETTTYSNDRPITLTNLYKVDGTLDLTCASSLDMLDNTEEMNKAITKFISMVGRKIKYPENSIKADIEGQVIVAFYINQDGLPYRIIVTKSLNKELDNEAIRVINSFKWPSPIYKGDKTFILVALPVTFKLK
jgi:periplasmic protein TonB